MNVELTPQETILLKLLLKGKTTKECATEMGLAVKTIRFYATNIYQKYYVNSKIELILLHARQEND